MAGAVVRHPCRASSRLTMLEMVRNGLTGQLEPLTSPKRGLELNYIHPLQDTVHNEAVMWGCGQKRSLL